MEKLNGKDINKLSYKDVVVYLFVCEYELRTIKQLVFLTGSNYSRLSESLNRLVKLGKIIKTEDYPNKYMKNDK